MKILSSIQLSLTFTLTATTVEAWLSSSAGGGVLAARRRTTSSSLHEQRFYSKGAEIYPPCNQKKFTLADSFPNGIIPPQAQSILAEKAPSLQKIGAEDYAHADADSAQGQGQGQGSSRRNFLLGISSVAAAGTAFQSVALPNKDTFAVNSLPITAMNIPQAIQWIDDNCDRRFLHAIVASDYSFLYYGVDGDGGGDVNANANVNVNGKSTTRTRIRSEKFNADLLDLDTYGTKEAVEYFQSVESILGKEVVKPSNGHLMTTSAKDASKWGTAASIWPIKGAHYAWFQDGGIFYPRDNASNIVREDFIIDGKDCGRESLEDALRTKGCEVMVTADNFLVVPASLDEELRDALRSSFLV